jgi:phage shock protein C
MEGKKFARSQNGKIFGVCAGLAEYLGVSVGAMRFIWIVFAILTLGLAFAAYIALTVLMLPPEGAPQGDRFWHHMDGRNIMMIFALALICLGAFILLEKLLGFSLGQFLFPVGLIAVGAIVMAFAFGGSRGKQ